MKFLSLFLQFFPAVLQGVIAVENALGSQPGATKKQVVMSAVTAAAKVGEGVTEQHVQVISQLVDSTVAALNQAGVFGKSVPTAPVKLKANVAMGVDEGAFAAAPDPSETTPIVDRA